MADGSRGLRSNFQIYDDISQEDLEQIAFEINKLGCTSFILNKEELEQILNDTNGETGTRIEDCGSETP